MKLLPLAAALVGILAADDNVALQVITLKDNSVIHAQVSEAANGFYFAKSPMLGDLKIPTGDVLSIKNETSTQNGTTLVPGTDSGKAADASTTNGSAAQQGIDALRSSISSKVQNLAATREGMAVLEQFSQNQEVKAVLGDSNTMKAVQSADYDALMKSPAVKKLMDDPQTKSLIQNVLKSSSQQKKTGIQSEGQ